MGLVRRATAGLPQAAPADAPDDARRAVSLDHGPSTSSEVSARRHFADVYALGALLGTGAFSRVCRCVHRRTRRSFAVKIVRFAAERRSDGDKAGGRQQPSTTRAEVEAELETCSLLRGCPGVLRLHETFVETGPAGGGGIVYAVFDLAEGGELSHAVAVRGSLPEEDARGVLRSLFETCGHMRRRGVVHRDIKLDNVLLLHGHQFDKGVMLTDLGLAGTLDDSADGSQLHEVCGTPMFMAPEMLKFQSRRSADGNLLSEGYGHEVDVWSCGVVLYVLLCGFPPFEAKSYREQFEQITSATVCFDDPAWALVTEEAHDLVMRCLDRDPRARITAEEAMKHPWMMV